MHNRLHFFSGKMASGKSTLAKKLAKEHNAVLLSEDEILTKLYPNEIHTLQDYVNYSHRVKEMLQEHIIDLLQKGCAVVLDFPANTAKQRAWFKVIFESAGVEHTLHFVDKSDAICKAQLKIRSQELPKSAPFTSDEAFDNITQYFEAPQSSEGFEIVRYE